MLRKASRIALGSTLILTGLFRPLPPCEGQNSPARTDHDFYVLALNSVLESEGEFVKLADISQRVKLLIYAAKVLPASHRNEAMHFLDLALSDLKELGSQEKTTSVQRNLVANWRNEVLVAYAAINPERALSLQKEFQPSQSSGGNSGQISRSKNYNWFMHFRGQRTNADQTAKLALSLLSTEPEKAFPLVIDSLQGGVISGVLFDIVTKLKETGNRTLLHQIELAMGHSLTSTITLDPLSLTYTTVLLRSDDEMPVPARNALLSFLVGSLQAWTSLVREPGGNSWVDAEYISSVFTAFLLNVRPTIVQYSPKQLLNFDWLLEQVGPWVPEGTKTRLQAFKPETFSDPGERLTDILKDPAPDRRDLRLVRLVSELLRNESEDFQKRSELAANAIDKFSDPEMKSSFTDLLTIARANALTKQNKFIEAREATDSISATETRAWALLAVSLLAAKADSVLGFELISQALKVLESASPTPHKVELALSAAGMLAKDNPERAFETLSAAARYANSSASRSEATKKPPVAFGLEAKIGQAHHKLGVAPESLDELTIDSSLSLLAKADWFRASQIVREIHEPSLRLHLRLRFAEAVLAQEVKAKPNTSTKKPSTRN